MTRGRSRLDEHFARWFGDDQPTHLGTGWFSGTASVFFGALGLGAVICLHYPALLTQVDLRAHYPMPVVRALIQIVIGAGFLFGLLAALLRARKALAITGLALSLAALLLGGADVPIDGPLGGRLYLGLDWFLLNLLLLATIFVPLERLFALRQEQEVFRPGWTTDTLHFLVSHLLVQVTTLLTVMPATVLAEVAAPRVRPRVVIAAAGAAVRGSHGRGRPRRIHDPPAVPRGPRLWRFHQIHHSSVALDWLAGSRLHLVDVVVTRAFTFVPIVLLGSPAAVYAYLVFVSFHAVFIHANVRFRGGWLERVIVMPRFHHWHHSAEPEAVDKNFAVHMPCSIGCSAPITSRWALAGGVRHRGPPGARRLASQLVEPFKRPRGGNAPASEMRGVRTQKSLEHVQQLSSRGHGGVGRGRSGDGRSAAEPRIRSFLAARRRRPRRLRP